VPPTYLRIRVRDCSTAVECANNFYAKPHSLFANYLLFTGGLQNNNKTKFAVEFFWLESNFYFPMSIEVFRH
jgi:hypothetical protein